MTTWTGRVLGVLAIVAACGDDGGGQTATTLPMVTTAPASSDPSVGDESSSTSGQSGSDTSNATGGATSSPTTTLTTGPEPTTDPTNVTTAATSGTSSGTTTGGIDDTGLSTSSSETTSDIMKLDVGVLLDVPPPVCVQCALTIASKQSGTLDVQGANIFATAKLTGQDVYALGTYGQGRFIAAADSSLPFNEQTDCPLTDWLAGNGGNQPKVLRFGWTPNDGPGAWNVQADVAYVHLPAQYIGNPGLLLQDYDIVFYLESSFQHGADEPSNLEMTTLLDYLTMGGGMYVSSEFYGYLQDPDITSVNRLLIPLGAPTQKVSLNWGNVDGNIDFECFPEPQ